MDGYAQRDDRTAAEVVECPDCGLLQRMGIRPAKHLLTCVRCAAPLTPSQSGNVKLAAACAVLGALLLLVAVREPVFTMHLLGRYASAGLVTGPKMLAERGLPSLSIVVGGILLVAPALHLGSVTIALLGAAQPKPPRFAGLALAFAETTSRWSMFDVFLLAALVCYVRLRSWTSVEVGGAIAAIVALFLLELAAKAALDADALWKRVPWLHEAPKTPHGHAISCERCRLVSPAKDGDPCPRCGRTLHTRRPRALTRGWALLIAAMFLCVPANGLPVMDMVRFGRSRPDTIFSGVVELIHHGLWGLAAVIFAASIVIPLLKIVVLAILLGTTANRRPEHLVLRTRCYRIVRDLGRWSLVDVFAVGILVSLVHLGPLASVLPGRGAVAFCAVVILTMLATESFDPRLMWDAAGENGAAAQERVA